MDKVFNLDTATPAELAQLCTDSAADMQGEPPERFWGLDNYGKTLRGTLRYIEQIGIEEARRLAAAKKLNFPASIYEG